MSTQLSAGVGGHASDPRAGADEVAATRRALIAAGRGHVSAGPGRDGIRAVFGAAAALAARASNVVTVFDHAPAQASWLAELGPFASLTLRFVSSQTLNSHRDALSGADVLVVAGQAVPRTGPVPGVLAGVLAACRHPLLLVHPFEALRMHQLIVVVGGADRWLTGDPLAISA